MNRKEITIEQFEKLKPCSVFNSHKQMWIDGRFRIVRKGKTWDTVAWLFNDCVLQNLYRKSYVKP